MKVEVTLAGQAREVEVRRVEQGWQVRLDDGAWMAVEAERTGADWRVRLPGRPSRTLGVALSGDDVFVRDGVVPLRGTVVDPRLAALAEAGAEGAGRVVSPMPGAVVRVLVQVGARVSQGQVLVVVEAMKMENEFKAPVDGVVTHVEALVGLAVEAGALLVAIEKDA